MSFEFTAPILSSARPRDDYMNGMNPKNSHRQHIIEPISTASSICESFIASNNTSNTDSSIRIVKSMDDVYSALKMTCYDGSIHKVVRYHGPTIVFETIEKVTPTSVNAKLRYTVQLSSCGPTCTVNKFHKLFVQTYPNKDFNRLRPSVSCCTNYGSNPSTLIYDYMDESGTEFIVEQYEHSYNIYEQSKIKKVEHFEGPKRPVTNVKNTMPDDVYKSVSIQYLFTMDEFRMAETLELTYLPDRIQVIAYKPSVQCTNIDTSKIQPWWYELFNDYNEIYVDPRSKNCPHDITDLTAYTAMGPYQIFVNSCTKQKYIYNTEANGWIYMPSSDMLDYYIPNMPTDIIREYRFPGVDHNRLLLCDGSDCENFGIKKCFYHLNAEHVVIGKYITNDFTSWESIPIDENADVNCIARAYSTNRPLSIEPSSSLGKLLQQNNINVSSCLVSYRKNKQGYLESYITNYSTQLEYTVDAISFKLTMTRESEFYMYFPGFEYKALVRSCLLLNDTIEVYEYTGITDYSIKFIRHQCGKWELYSHVKKTEEICNKLRFALNDNNIDKFCDVITYNDYIVEVLIVSPRNAIINRVNTIKLNDANVLNSDKLRDEKLQSHIDKCDLIVQKCRRACGFQKINE